ncbi:hypothetical protein ACOALZ_08455 [Nocardiopsis algeriensis]|uniref:hypothetical protein n=1 Tax=Nocardiopsis algeriensis TaxID=1478215 RepID=UPI003B43D104
MPEYHGFAKDTPTALEPGRWYDIVFDRRDDGVAELRELVDDSHPHGALHLLSVGVVLTGLTPRCEVRLRAVEFESSGRVFRECAVDSRVQVRGKGRFGHTWQGLPAPGRWVGVRVAQHGRADAHLTEARAGVFAWPG